MTLKPDTLETRMAAEVELFARKVAKAAVEETFLTFGVDLSTPGTVLDVQQDFAHLRASRVGLQAIRRGAILSAVTIFLTGVGSGLWWLLKAVAASTGKTG